MELVAIVNAEVINDLLSTEYGVKFTTNGILFGTGDDDGDFKLEKENGALTTDKKVSGVWDEKDATF